MTDKELETELAKTPTNLTPPPAPPVPKASPGNTPVEKEEPKAKPQVHQHPKAADREETSDELEAHIQQLKEKLKKVQVAEEGEDVAKITLPLANILLKTEKNQTTPLNRVTPPEVMLLVAEHHAAAGEMPVIALKLTGDKVDVDPRAYRQYLISRYGGNKVNALFPGAVPNLPKTFKYAMNTGLAAALPNESLMDFKVTPING